jgi:hypothetical protein
MHGTFKAWVLGIAGTKIIADAGTGQLVNQLPFVIKNPQFSDHPR